MEVKMKSVKSWIVCLVLLCGAAVLMAQSPQWEWVTRAGRHLTDLGRSIAADGQGNQYVTGKVTTMINPNSNIIVIKSNPNGNRIWSVSAGGTGNDEGFGIAVDGAGNVYVTGYFTGTATFGSHTLTAIGDSDIFVAKLNPSGTWLWAVKAGGTYGEVVNDVAVDGAGNAYVTGYYDGTPYFGNHTLPTAQFGSDIFVAKLNPSGTWLWAVKAGAMDVDYGCGIAVDGAGNAYVTGYFAGSATFGSHSLIALGHDIFVAKLNPSGTWLWAVQTAGSYSVHGSDIAIDGAGNAYVTGNFAGTAYFGSHTLDAGGLNYDIFVAKLGPSGTWLWAAQAGGGSDDYAFGIAVDGAGNTWVTGDSATIGSRPLTSSRGRDIFAAKLNPSGTWLWAGRAGGTDSDSGFGIAVDGAGNAYVTGHFTGTATFGSHTLSAMGGTDIFTAKLSYIPPKAPVNVQITMNGNSAVITWDAVTEDIHNQPFTPDGYYIYESSDPLGGFTYLGHSSSTAYIDSSVGEYEPRVFYRVKAYKN
jgi:hypothetical protein